MICVKGLVKSFKSGRILDGATFEARAGEVTALVGPSGGGKSTLLRCINGLESFEAGSVEVDELTLRGGVETPSALLLALRRKVGMVFQEFHLFGHMTALDNVLSGPRFVLGKSREEAAPQALALLERVGLRHKANAYPRELSGGQKQRVAIARSLAMDPVALLFDEPTSALDPDSAKEVVDVIEDLAKTGRAMVVVTHSAVFADRAHAVYRICEGRVESRTEKSSAS